MKKISQIYKELGIAFTFPIKIKNTDGRTTYHEATNGFCYKFEYDSNDNATYYETSDGYFENREYDSDGEVSYYENSTGEKIGTPKNKTL